MKCNNNVDDFCTHYNKAAPPDNICSECKFWEDEKPDANRPSCVRNHYDDEQCLFVHLTEDGKKLDHYEWINRLTCEGSCKYAEFD